MNGSNEPAVWQNFYMMMGTANAAITGLVFVALSIPLRGSGSHKVTTGESPGGRGGFPGAGAKCQC